MQSIIETIFIFVVLSILSRHLTKAEPLGLAQSFGAIDQNDFAAHPHPRFGRFRRAADDSVAFPKEDEAKPKTENEQPDLPKVDDEAAANVNGTDADLESRFGLFGGGRRGGGRGGGLFSGLAQGLISGLAGQGLGGQNYGPGYGGYGPGYGGYPGGGYPGGYYPGNILFFVQVRPMPSSNM